jgi:hypothetical protein
LIKILAGRWDFCLTFAATLLASASGSHGSIVIPSPSGSAGEERQQPISTSVSTAVLITRAPQLPVVLDANHHRHVNFLSLPWMFPSAAISPLKCSVTHKHQTIFISKNLYEKESKKKALDTKMNHLTVKST